VKDFLRGQPRLTFSPHLSFFFRRRAAAAAVGLSPERRAISMLTAMRLIFARAAYIAATLTLFSSAAHAAGGAFFVDDASVDEPYSCKVESWGSLGSNTASVAVTSPACVLPLFRPTEIGFSIVRTRSETGDWGTGLIVKPKMNLLPVETGKVGLAVSGGPAFDLATGEFAGAFLNVPVTYTASDSFKINVNAGWIYDHDSNRHSASYGAGVEWIPGKPFTIIAEVFGVLTSNPDARTVTDPRFQVGLRITPIDTMDFDVIYGRNIYGENASWITVGWNVRFPPPKKEGK